MSFLRSLRVLDVLESHLRRLFERLGVASRTELAARALREGWLEEVG